MTSAKHITSVPRLPPRKADAHKGNFGRVLVVGGSAGMIGAPALAANSALRGGAGLVTFAAPAKIQPFVSTLCVCATSVPLDCDDDTQLQASSVRQVLKAAERADVIAAGPGMGTGPRQAAVLRALLGQEKPLVVDADGLNSLTLIENWPALRRCPMALTPHPGEFSRLTGASIGDIQGDREGAATSAAQEWTSHCEKALVIVLKGAGTVVTDGGRIFINDTGNPGMATGGSGDVLTGLLAATIAQGLEPFEAACLAVHAHGLAGDLAAEALGQVSMIASDLLKHLGAAIREHIGS